MAALSLPSQNKVHYCRLQSAHSFDFFLIVGVFSVSNVIWLHPHSAYGSGRRENDSFSVHRNTVSDCKNV
jgi:hypothetical protein